MPTLGARFRGPHLERALQAPRLLESPVSSLFHELLPGNQDIAPTFWVSAPSSADGEMPGVALSPACRDADYNAASRSWLRRFAAYRARSGSLRPRRELHRIEAASGFEVRTAR
jgi:hypothetical protein